MQRRNTIQSPGISKSKGFGLRTLKFLQIIDSFWILTSSLALGLRQLKGDKFWQDQVQRLMQETKNYKQLHFEQKQVINVPQNLNLSLGNERIGETEL